MAKRGGFPGGMPGNMNNLMKQAQKMQRQMEEAQKELEEKEITAAAGGGAVEVTVSGKREITKVKLSEEVVDPDDIEMLEDLIMAATNEALRQLEEFSSDSMSKITGGMGGLGNGKMPDIDADDAEQKMARVEAIIYSMTIKERQNPDIITPQRKRRIAAGAGVDISEVNKMMKQFEQMRKMMKSFPGMMGGKGKKGKFKMPF